MFFYGSMLDVHNQPAAGAYPDFDPRLSPLAIALMERRLGELRRLSTLALDRVRHLELALEDRMDERERKLLIGRGGISVEFPRALRCFRQVAALELEILGLRKAPDRSEPTEADADDDRDESDSERPDLNDLNDRDDRPETRRQLLADTKDYRKGPLDIVVAEIRQILGVEPPEDDPFAPPPGRRAAKPRADAEKIAEPAAPEHPAPAEGAKSAGNAPVRATRPAKPAHPHPPFVITPAKPRRALTRLLSGTARNRGPPH
jgi:hypothetical protein